MKILGITAEYNPFHNGHKYHIEESRRITGADCVVVVMSGNFTQRGESAILDKWERSRLAVENGADLVVELPFAYACSRAEIFAKGAVDVLSGLGADIISFGSESGDIEKLKILADMLYHRADEIASRRRQLMQSGISFAKAGEIAVGEILGKSSAALMLEPNNILALEYLKRIISHNERGYAVETVTVARRGSGYFEKNEEAGFAGASAIRKMKSADEIKKFVPENTADTLISGEKYKSLETDEICKPVYECALNTEERMFRLLRYEVIKSSVQELGMIYHMGEGLENKLKKEIIHAHNMQELVSAMVSKRYTEAAIRRLLVYVLMGIRKNELPEAVYGRVLAANENGRRLLAHLKKQDGHIPLITNINKIKEESEDVQSCLHYDVMAADMYNLLRDRDMYAFSDKVRRPYMA